MLLKYNFVVFFFKFFVFFNNFFNKNKVQLRVLNFHEILPKEFPVFSKYIINLKKNWQIISPDEFKLILSKKKKIKKNSLLITFDDGFKSQYLIAKKILKTHNIKCIFFVINDFLMIRNKNDAKKFIRQRLFPNQKVKINRATKNLNIKHLKYLKENGHTIGWHTKTHARCTDLSSPADLFNEIVLSSKKLEKKLNFKFDDFAFTFGNYKSINSVALNFANKNFNYVYSGLRGNNLVSQKKFIIRRDVINFDFSHKLIDFFLNGYGDFLYSGKLKVIDAWNAKKF